MPQVQYEEPDDSDTLHSEIAEIVQYPDAWLDTPNAQLNGQEPRKLMETSEGRSILFNLVQEIRHGMIT